MRVHSISIENITSLKGKHSIDFDEILHGEDLFAITGPTGSGKSSILAAISLALYNSNYKESLGAMELITQGADFGKVELSFSTGNTEYKAIWECRLTQKNGTRLKAPKLQHTFYAEDEIIEMTGEEILGLSFDQFSKTIILNQGQFARFLTSKYKDRREILEKLYDSKTLAQLGTRLNEKIKTTKGELQGIELALENILPITKEQMVELSEELKATEERKNTLNSHQKQYRVITSEVRDYSNCIGSIKNNREKKVKYVGIVTENIAKSNQLKHVVEKAESGLIRKQKESDELRPRLIKCIELSNELIAKKRELGQHRTRIEQNTKAILLKNEQLEKACSEKEAITKGLAIFGKSHPALFVSDDEFEQYSSTVKKIRDISVTQLTKTESLQNFGDQQIEMENGLESLKQGMIKKEDNLDQYSLLASVDSLKEWQSCQHQAISELKKQIEKRDNNLRHRDLLIKNIDQFESELQSLREIDRDHNTNSEQIRLKINGAKTKLELILTQKKVQELEHAIAFVREESLQQQICLICDGEISSKKTSCNPEDTIDLSKLEELQNQVRTLELEESKLGGKIHNNSETIAVVVDKIKSTSSKLCVIKESESNSENADKQALLDQKVKESIIVPETHKQLLEEQLEFKTLLDKREKLNGLIATIGSEQANDSAQLFKFLSEIKTSFPHYPDNPEMLCAFFEEDTKIFHRIKRGIEKEQFAIRAVDKLKVDIDGLNRSKDDELKNEQLIEIHTGELTVEIKEGYDYSNPNEMLRELSDQLGKLSREHAGLREDLVSIERSIETHNQFISNLEETLKALDLDKNNTEGKLFEISVPRNIEEIDTSSTNVFLEKVKSNSTTEDPESQCDLILAFNTGILPETVSLIDKKTEELTKLFHQSETTLKHYQEAEQKSAKLKGDYQKLLDTLGRFQMLNEIIGKQEFRDYALSIIERELVFGANSELKKICDGRYVLKQIPSKMHKFEFFVVDNYSGGMERKVSTLSGGETFLVSLAMAMALSEMTRGQCEIDSFFIDEGFGSLDEDAIDDALDTLMQIRSRGKRIGIISHVRKLTERISVNINLVKTDLGESSIQIIS